LLALSMQTPPAGRTCMYHVNGMNTKSAKALSTALARLDGVVEAVVIADEGVAYLKVRMGEWDEAGAHELIEKRG